MDSISNPHNIVLNPNLKESGFDIVLIIEHKIKYQQGNFEELVEIAKKWDFTHESIGHPDNIRQFLWSVLSAPLQHYYIHREKSREDTLPDEEMREYLLEVLEILEQPIHYSEHRGIIELAIRFRKITNLWKSKEN